MEKIIRVTGGGRILSAKWNIIIWDFWGRGRARTKRYNLRAAVIDSNISRVLGNSSLGLGIKFVSPDPASPTRVGSMIQLGVYDGANEAEFVGVIMSNVLNDIYTDPDVFKIAFSIGREEGYLVVLVDSVGAAGELLGRGDGPGGGGATPARIPAP